MPPLILTLFLHQELADTMTAFTFSSEQARNDAPAKSSMANMKASGGASVRYTAVCVAK